MAGWKDTNITNPGTSIKYGADDEEMIMRMFNGVTTGINPVEIKSTNKWGFWDNIMYVRNQADTKNTFIRGQSNSPTTDVTLALPPITANDTLSAIGLTNIFSVKQEFDAGLLLKQQSAPPNPAATFNHFYAGTNGHLIRRDSTGAEFDYDVAQNGLPAGLNEEIQINNNGVFGSDPELWWDISSSELHTSGLVVSEDLLLTGDITPPQITTDQNNYSPSGWNNNTTLRLSSDTARNITGIGSQGEGTILFIHNVGSFNITLKDESTSSTDINRFAFPSDVVIGPDNTATIKYDGVTNRWRLISASTTSSGFAQLAVENTFTDTQNIQVDSAEILSLYRPTTTLGRCLFFDGNDSLGNRQNYARFRAEIADSTNGSEDGRLLVQLTQAGVVENSVGEFREDGTFRCGGPNRRVIISESGLTAQNTYTFPDITTKLAGLDAPNQVWTDDQMIMANQTDLLYLYNPTNTLNSLIDVNFDFQNSAATRVTYCDIRTTLIEDNAGAEEGEFGINIQRAGTKQGVLKLQSDGELMVGRDASNMRSVNTTLTDSSEEVTASNTTSETTVVSFVVKGNTIGVDGSIHLIINGTLTQNQATATTYTLRIKVGGTTIYEDGFGGSIAQNAVERPWVLNILFHPNNFSSTSGRMFGWAMMNDFSAPTTGQGAISDDETHVMANFKSSSYSWTFANDTTIAVTLQMSVASASANWRKDYHIVKQYFS